VPWRRYQNSDNSLRLCSPNLSDERCSRPGYRAGLILHAQTDRRITGRAYPQSDQWPKCSISACLCELLYCAKDLYGAVLDSQPSAAPPELPPVPRQACLAERPSHARLSRQAGATQPRRTFRAANRARFTCSPGMGMRRQLTLTVQVEESDPASVTKRLRSHIPPTSLERKRALDRMGDREQGSRHREAGAHADDYVPFHPLTRSWP
jgi:hypothetical protein